ncbi:DUF4491 family protein [Clostridium sp. 'White wine YQ']|uniref:DUF4491 family protein n=1 Tax=Clostridium sp. 'White wine YQ' TaxID=3027474 RepID=UPI0023650662|nr:DUF4491 family protein [Clostridium sp. 'White wine YQ']MDD7793896.1 DUF4491 family protein [Clostridium sp. 'White wine YQ']
MNYYGIIIGIGAFFIIGFLHPLVVKSEFYFGKRIWPLFLIGGIICLVGSISIKEEIASVLLGILGFALFWGIMELFEQENRVNKGWYPRNNKRK